MAVDFFSNFKSGTGHKSPDNRSSVISLWFRENFYIFKVNVIFAAKGTFFKKKKITVHAQIFGSNNLPFAIFIFVQ